MNVLQESLRMSFETTIIPAFESSCGAMFEQMNSTFQRGMAEHTSNAQQQFETSHSALAGTLQVWFFLLPSSLCGYTCGYGSSASYILGR